MMKIVLASGNPDKLREVKEILAGYPAEVISMKEAGFSGEIEENGHSFAENARIKSETICRATGAVTIADDSGLVVDAMGGEPGIYSARFLGEETPQAEKNAEIIRRLDGLTGPARSARFVCAMSCMFPDGTELTSEGVFEGEIGYEERGSNGFGYDPIFYLPEYGCTSAELSPEEKNQISHRGKALRSLAEKLRGRLAKTAGGPAGGRGEEIR